MKIEEQEHNHYNKLNNLNELLKYNFMLNQYLIGTNFEIFEAECKRNDLIQFLFNAEGFYKQAVIPFCSENLQFLEKDIQERFNKNINDILYYYKRAYEYIPQRKKGNDWEFYVALRTAIIDNTDSINMELNGLITKKDKRR